LRVGSSVELYKGGGDSVYLRVESSVLKKRVQVREAEESQLLGAVARERTLETAGWERT
jgi:hypothetical protein